MNDRGLARAIGLSAEAAARETQMLRRGVIEGIGPDGRCMVRLPGGGLVDMAPPAMFTPSQGQAITYFRQGSVWEIQTPSAFSGGLGSAYVPPQEP